MTRETFIILIKALFTSVGAFLIGKNFLGHNVDTIVWEAAVGCILSGISIFWSIQDKEYNIEKLQASMRQILLFAGGFLVSSGRITNEQLETITGAAIIVIPTVQSYVSKNKVKMQQENKINTSQLASIPTEKEQRKRKLE